MVYIFYGLFLILTGAQISNQENKLNRAVRQMDFNPDVVNWQTMEEISEFHPYMVGLLDNQLVYHCTGSILNRDTVVTAANCIGPELQYIGIGLAFIDAEHYVNNNSLKIIKSTKLSTGHLAKSDEKIPLYQYRVGLVYSVSRDLTKYFGFVDIFSYEFFSIEPYFFEVVGYGTYPEKFGSALQKRLYNQTACPNHVGKSVCGIEFFEDYIYEDDTLGKGAAAFFFGELYGVSGWKCGVFTTDTLEASCEMFTKLQLVKLDETPIAEETTSLRTIIRYKNAAQKKTFVNHIHNLLVFIVFVVFMF